MDWVTLRSNVTEQATALWSEMIKIWNGGGWAMYALAGIALIIFASGFRIYFALQAKGFQRVREDDWRRWLKRPAERRGRVGEILDFTQGADSLPGMASRFEEVSNTETLPLQRDLKVMSIFVSAAPLVGLLGTVTGMLSTFGALSTGSGGDQTMGMIAAGISEALYTTETGLVVALPGLFFHYFLNRKFEKYRALLTHLETACTLGLQRNLRESERSAAREIARRQVAARLRERMRDRQQDQAIDMLFFEEPQLEGAS